MELHWIPAHANIKGNEQADTAAKQATGWRTVKKRNQKFQEIGTQWTAPTPPGFPFLRTAINAHVRGLLGELWAKDWASDKRGRELFRIIPTPTKKVLHLHKGIKKWTSALVVQMRTQKIGLRKFLHSRKVPGYGDPKCVCGRGLQTVLHLLTECPLYYKQRGEMWNEEKRKNAWIGLGLRLILNRRVYARKAALFMKNTDLIGQFNGLTMSLND